MKITEGAIHQIFRSTSLGICPMRIKINEGTNNTQNLGLIKLFHGPLTNSSNEKSTRALGRTYMKRVLLTQTNYL